MSGYHFTQEDHEYMRQIGKELAARRERNDPPLDSDGLMDLVESVVNRVVAPPWHAVYDTREFDLVPKTRVDTGEMVK